MATINISANVDKALSALDNLRKQIPFITSLAINRTAQSVKAKEEHEIRDVFDRPTPFIQNSVFIKPSNKRNLTSKVGLKEFASKGNPATKILAAEIAGGSRRLKRYEVALKRVGALPDGYYTVPGEAAKIDQYGNIARAQVIQMLAYFKAFPEAGYKANATDATKAKLAKGSKKKFGVSYFVGRPKGGKSPLGIWMRVYSSFGTAVRPIMIFVQHAQYQPIFDFKFVAENTVNKEFDVEFRRAFNEVIGNGVETVK